MSTLYALRDQRLERRNRMNSNQTPIARRTGIVIKKLDGEILVYDTEHHQAHCLNQTAALIWEHCDGNRVVSDLSNLLDVTATSRQKEQMVWIALTELEKVGLLETSIAKPEILKGMTRRQLIKAAGIAALVAIPIVSTMVAPTATQAAT